MFAANRWMLALGLLLASPAALASPRAGKGPAHARRARVTKHEVGPRGCLKAPIAVVHGAETTSVSLTKCDGAAASDGIERLSALAGTHGATRLDARLIEEVGLIVDHFRGDGPARIVLVSGYRPKSTGSYHSKGRALDFRVEGAPNEAVVAFCKTLPDTGCGYYPNAGFVHVDVRERGSGHVSWTDVSRPGEAPRYVKVDESPAEGALRALPGPGRSDAADVKKPQGPVGRASRDERLHTI